MKLIKKVFKKGWSKLVLMFVMIFAMTMVMCSTVFATVTPVPVDYSDVTEALTSSFTPAQITTVIAAILAAGVGLMLLWWGARKLVNAVITAFKSGKIKL